MICNNRRVFDVEFNFYLFSLKCAFILNTISWQKLETCAMNSSPDNYIVIVPTHAFKYFCYNFEQQQVLEL